MDDQLKQSALDFHEFPIPGKIQVVPTKPLATQRDLALAYSPGVAAPCLEIEKDPLAAYKYTARGNLVAVVSNGTAVLGLGNIGALAGKPVMEGKGVLFKKFAGIDVFDIEVDELDPDKFIDVVAALEPTFGGINLEDIKAPECFYIEQKLRARMNIPVFHDDQHGTAIISTAAIINGLRVVEKNISDIRMVVSGAGAAAIACMNLLVALGMQKHNIVVCDSKGVIYKDREPNMAETKAAYAVVDDGKRTLDDVIDGADIFLGCSGPKVLTQEMVKKMARAPMILALAAFNVGGSAAQVAFLWIYVRRLGLHLRQQSAHRPVKQGGCHGFFVGAHHGSGQQGLPQRGLGRAVQTHAGLQIQTPSGLCADKGRRAWPSHSPCTVRACPAPSASKVQPSAWRSCKGSTAVPQCR